MADNYTESLNDLKALLAADATGRTLRARRNRRRRRFVATSTGLGRNARIRTIIATLPGYVAPIGD